MKIELTAIQKWYYEMWQLAPQSNAFNMTNMQFHLTGKLDLQRLEQALLLHRRFEEAARVYFTEEDSAVKQVIMSPDEVADERSILNIIDLANDSELKSEQARKDKAIAIHKEIMLQSSDLNKYPLIQYHLIKYGPENHLFTIVMPHIIFDGASCTMFLNNISDLYNEPDATTARFSAITEPKSMADYVKHADSIADKYDAAEAKYWQSVLEGVDSLQIPLPRREDVTQQPDSGAKMGLELFAFSAELTHQLEQIAAQKATTLFVVICALFSKLLYQLSNQQDMIIGYAANTRPKEFANMMGCFVNEFPLRVQLNDDLSMDDLIEQISKRRLEDRQHQNYSIEKIIEDKIKSTPGFCELQPNIVINQGRPYPRGLNLRNIQVEPRPLCEEANIIVDIMLVYNVYDGTAEFSWMYDRKAYSEDFIAKMHKDLSDLAEGLVSTLEDELQISYRP